MIKSIKTAVYRICRKKQVKNIHKIQYENLKKYDVNDYDLSHFNKHIIYFPKKNKKRLIFHYGKDITIEKILCKSVAQILEKKLHCKTKNKKQITTKLFDTLLKLDKNYSIVTFDMKNFYQTISTQYCYEAFIKQLNLPNDADEILKKFISLFPYCIQGISLSNTIANIIAKNLDEKIINKFSQDNLLFYARFVDDGFVVLNKKITKEQALNVVLESINEINQHSKQLNLKYKNKLKLNIDKFKFISSDEANTFCCLGYEWQNLLWNFKTKTNRIPK